MPSIERYLARIGVSAHGLEIDYPSLARLHRQHLYTIPFENLDIIDGRPLSLDLEALADKILDRRRGGFCYELNGFFAWLLESSGFSVDRLSARVVRPDTGEIGPPRDHLCLRVVADGRPWLCDVGFGRAFLEPLPLDGKGPIVNMDGGVFWLLPVDGELLLRRAVGDDEPVDLYRIDPTPRTLSDFEAMFRWHQTDPDSPFPHGPIATRARPDGRDSARALKVTVETGGTKEERELGSVDEVRAWIRTTLGL
ncbi:MAG: acetyltransferase [Planctomycetes bacterium]|nr:acetyltransferase [Planctomycetota bacterium]